MHLLPVTRKRIQCSFFSPTVFADRAAADFDAATLHWELPVVRGSCRPCNEKPKIRSAIGEARSSHIGPGQQLVLYRVVHMVSCSLGYMLEGFFAIASRVFRERCLPFSAIRHLSKYD